MHVEEKKATKREQKMSKQYPECPLYNHATCKELHNPNICAIVRDDKSCTKKRQKATEPREQTAVSDAPADM